MNNFTEPDLIAKSNGPVLKIIQKKVESRKSSSGFWLNFFWMISGTCTVDFRIDFAMFRNQIRLGEVIHLEISTYSFSCKFILQENYSITV